MTARMSVDVEDKPSKGGSKDSADANNSEDGASIGRVVAVSGGQVICLLDAATTASVEKQRWLLRLC